MKEPTKPKCNQLENRFHDKDDREDVIANLQSFIKNLWRQLTGYCNILRRILLPAVIGLPAFNRSHYYYFNLKRQNEEGAGTQAYHNSCTVLTFKLLLTFQVAVTKPGSPIFHETCITEMICSWIGAEFLYSRIDFILFQRKASWIVVSVLLLSMRENMILFFGAHAAFHMLHYLTHMRNIAFHACNWRYASTLGNI